MNTLLSLHAWGDSSSCQEESSPAQHVPIPCTLRQQLQTEARFPSFPENACWTEASLLRRT